MHNVRMYFPELVTFCKQPLNAEGMFISSLNLLVIFNFNHCYLSYQIVIVAWECLF